MITKLNLRCIHKIMYMLYLKQKLNTHFIQLYKMSNIVNIVNIENAIERVIKRNKLVKDESLVRFEKAIDDKFNIFAKSLEQMVTIADFQYNDGVLKELFHKVLVEMYNINSGVVSLNIQMNSETNNDGESSIAPGVVHKRVESRKGKQSINMFFKGLWTDNEEFRTDSGFATNCSAAIKAGLESTVTGIGISPEKALKNQATAISRDDRSSERGWLSP